MASSLSNFERLLQLGASQNFRTTASRESIDWFKNRARQITNINATALMRRGANNLKNVPTVGQMYMFYYDPKLKKELPYYDTFPLIFPINHDGGGFLGINLHYLPPMLRARLMDALYGYISDLNMDEKTRLNISYNILRGVSKLRYFKPCIKYYLISHLRSQFLWVDPKEWNLTLFLPTERFKKATKDKVHRDSRKMI